MTTHIITNRFTLASTQRRMEFEEAEKRSEEFHELVDRKLRNYLSDKGMNFALAENPDRVDIGFHIPSSWFANATDKDVTVSLHLRPGNDGKKFTDADLQAFSDLAEAVRSALPATVRKKILHNVAASEHEIILSTPDPRDLVQLLNNARIFNPPISYHSLRPEHAAASEEERERDSQQRVARIEGSIREIMERREKEASDSQPSNVVVGAFTHHEAEEDFHVEPAPQRAASAEKPEEDAAPVSPLTATANGVLVVDPHASLVTPVTNAGDLPPLDVALAHAKELAAPGGTVARALLDADGLRKHRRDTSVTPGLDGGVIAGDAESLTKVLGHPTGSAHSGIHQLLANGQAGYLETLRKQKKDDDAIRHPKSHSGSSSGRGGDAR